MRLRLLSFLLTFFLSASCSAQPTGTAVKRAIYQSAQAPQKWAAASLLKKDYAIESDPPLYLLEDGHLYLLLQVTWPGTGLATEVRHQNWTSEKVTRVFASGAERKLLPNPSMDSGGIAWIEGTAQETNRK